MMPLDKRRRFYAEEIEAISDLHTAALVDALATVPRERFLRPGPWIFRSEAEVGGAPPRQTRDADPRHVYHNIAVALDPARQLFNGAPGLLAMVIDRLNLRTGARAVHIGCGTGYYTALIAHCVGPSGRVLAVDVDETLAAEARTNLGSMPWVDVRTGDGHDVDAEADAVLVNAGVTHLLHAWLDALKPGGRIAVPLTVAMTPTLGKGLMILLTSGGDGEALDARTIGFVAIYNAIAIRDDTMERQLREAMQQQPFPALKRLRRDAHAVSRSCWLHREGGCLSTA